jgi:hypothetical protein
MEEEFLQLFWGVKVPANGKVRLPILDDLYTEFTGACLGELTGLSPASSS